MKTDREDFSLPTDGEETRLQREIDDLKRQLAEQKRLLEDRERAARRPSKRGLGVLLLISAVIVVALFIAGYLPRTKREAQLVAEAKTEAGALPKVIVSTVERASLTSDLVLPGNLQPVTETAVLAKTDGYLKRRYADIGDRVAAGQVLAEIEAPELDRQIQQAKAAVAQTQSVLEQAAASLEQGRTNEELARVTATRWANLVGRGVVSRQENDQYQAQSKSQAANVKALEKALAAARSNVAASEANVARLIELKSYQQIRAPFAGVVTLRNVDTGALVTPGSTLLFRIAQTGTLRAYVNLPQNHARDVRAGQEAILRFTDIPGREFSGTVARTSNALDAASRTLLVEVRVPNPDGTLLPGMYADVDLNAKRSSPPLLIPGEALVVRAQGTMAATVAGDGSVHFQKIAIGRDFGDRIEVLAGLEEGRRVVISPNDAVQEGAKVDPVEAPRTPRPGAAQAGHK